MYKVLIVEDEEIFRRVLPVIVDWNSMGFEIVGEVENGFRALEFLEKSRVDVILTDIRMPVLNGLELAMEVKARYPWVKVLVLSAFDDFDYARKGIECGVYGYILKSEGEEEIVQYFTRLKDVLDQENTKCGTDSGMWDERERFFRSILIAEAGTEKDIMGISEKLNIFKMNQVYEVTLFQLDEHTYISNLMGSQKFFTINNLIRTYLFEQIEMKKLGTVIPTEHSVCIIWAVSDKSFNSNLTQIFNSLNEELAIFEKSDDNFLSVSCSVGGQARDLAQLKTSYQEAQSVLLHRAYIKCSSIINYREIDTDNIGTLTFAEEEKLIREFLIALHRNDTMEVIEYLERVEEGFIAARYTDSDMISTFAIKMVLSIVQDIGKMGSDTGSLILKSNYLIKEIGYCETIPLIFKKLKDFTIEASVFICEENQVQNRKIVDEAVKFIRENYARQIGLEEVARYVNVHPVHLSRLFSRDLGETFRRILTNIRIEEAKKLLKDINYRVYEVSQLVGYEKPRYFSELFRGMTGFTPLEFREKYK